jgi:hypothetical protein
LRYWFSVSQFKPARSQSLGSPGKLPMASLQTPMIRSPGPIIEFACKEGNYGMTGILSGARGQEKAEAAKGSR